MKHNFQFLAPGGPNSNICNKLLEIKGPTYRVQTFFYSMHLEWLYDVICLQNSKGDWEGAGPYLALSQNTV